MTNKTTPDRYALVGHPVEHSRSPLIHTVFARQTGQRLTYELIDAEPPAFETAVRGFGAAGGKGMNVTVPHKEAAFALCSRSSEAATAAGAVNTISIADGVLTVIWNCLRSRVGTVPETAQNPKQKKPA